MRRHRLRTRTKEWLIRAGLVALVLSAPVVTAATLLKAASGSGQTQLAAPSAAAESAAGSPPNVVPLVAGVLYTNGPAKVNWNGVIIPVENSSYAYTGGEVITTAPNAMGILRLTGGNTIFVCPGSQVRLSRGPSGSFSLNIAEGSSRFMFDTQTPFEVIVNDTTLTPETAVPPPESNGEKQMYVGEAQAVKDGGCVLCGLKNNMRVSSPANAGGKPVAAKAGQIVTVPGAKTPRTATTTTTTAATGGSVRDDGERKITKVAIPEKVFSTMAVGIDPSSGGAKGIGYLCKCQKLKEYAEEVEQLLAKQAEEEAANTNNGDTQTADASDVASDADGPEDPNASQETEVAQGPNVAQDPEARQPDAVADSGPPEPDLAPPVEPPAIPDLVVADAGPPDPFIPGLTPAAGDPSNPSGSPADSGTPIILPPPLIPGSGSGGGGVVSPS